MNDRELLEQAAKPAGVRGKYNGVACEFYLEEGGLDPTNRGRSWWNPLTDDGDCGRLEAKLDINIEWWSDSVCCTVDSGSSWTELFADHEDKNAARRYASTALAAEIGKGLK